MNWTRKLLFGLGALAIGWILLKILVPKPPLMEGVPFSQAILDRDGQLLRLTLAGDQNYRLPVHLSEISPEFIQATLLYEDRCFYWHPGVNPWTLAKAVLSVGTHGRKFGASTLTMQLVRIRYGLNTRTWSGKLWQIVRALQIELHYSKREILEAYFTLASYGGNIEGVEAASLIYYRHPARSLTLEQSLVLSVIPQSPLRRTLDTHRTTSTEPALETIHHLWLSTHGNRALSLPTLQMPLPVSARAELPHQAMHFTQMIHETVPQSGLVSTTLRLDWQEVVEARLKEHLQRHSPEGLNNAAALLLDYTTMETLAYVGSADFWNESSEGQCDGVRMQRSPGSTLKPFIYGQALEQGLIHPSTHLLDAPISYADYDPENFDRTFLGPLTAREALRQSRNVPAVVLLAKLKNRNLYSLLQDYHVEGLKPESQYGLALALGGAEISPLTMGSMYAMLANHGQDRPISFLQSRTPGPIIPDRRLMSPEASFLALDMIRSDLRPCEGRAVPMSAPVAWKTGTSHGFRDAWCVGVFDRYVLVVWVGDFHGTSNPALVGRQAAAPLFFSIVDSIRSREEPGLPAPWCDPAGLHLVKEEICTETGFLAGPTCRHHYPEWFIPGVSPIQSSEGKELLAANDSGPRITSPKPYPCYYVRPHGAVGEDSLALEARVGPKVQQIFWFANQALIGQSAPGRQLWWKPVPGDYTLTLMDDSGRSDSLKIHIEAEGVAAAL